MQFKPLFTGLKNPFLDISPKHLKKRPWESDETPVSPGSNTSETQNFRKFSNFVRLHQIGYFWVFWTFCEYQLKFESIWVGIRGPKPPWESDETPLGLRSIQGIQHAAYFLRIENYGVGKSFCINKVF